VDNQIKPQKIHQGINIFVSVVLITSLLAGCQLPGKEKQEIAIPMEDKSAELPTPTKEPRLDLPPALVETKPLPNSVIGLNESITLFFNQAMDHSAVEAAMHFEPRTSGRFHWEDAQTVTFSPDQKFNAGSRLSVIVNTTAQAENHKNLLEPIELSFQVVDYLNVTQVTPENGSQDVDPESVVFVAFNQPVVNLGEDSSAAPGFYLTPEVTGKGSWLNTSTYIFTPEFGLSGGTTYRVQINENLLATSGATFSPAQSYEYEFSTKQPEIEKILPPAGELLRLDSPLEVFFNMRMDVESVEENFSLIDSNGNKVQGKFEWEKNNRHLKFTPIRNLSRDTNYTIRLGQEMRSAGGLPVLEGLQTERQTYPEFAVNTAVDPQFESFYGGYGRFTLEFTAPLDPLTMDKFINLSPEVVNLSFYTGADEESLSIYGYFQPETIYTLTLGKGLKDIWGGELKGTFSTTFFTPPAQPLLHVSSGYTSYNLIFLPESALDLSIQATNIQSFSLEIAPVSIEDLITLLNPENFHYREIYLPEVREITTYNLNLPRNQIEVLSLPLSYRGDPLTSGIYFLGLSTPDISEEDYDHYQKYFLVVSANNLVMKVSPEQVFVWATQLENLSPLSDAPVLIYNTEGELLHRDSVNVDGLFIGELTRPEDPFSTYFTVTGSPGNTDFGFTISSWQENIQYFEKGIQLNTLPELLDVYIYTDRPIYRPGDTVNFRSVVFSRENGLPVQSGLDFITVTINSNPGLAGRSEILYKERLQLSRFGTAAGSFELPTDMLTGYSYIDVSVEDTLIKSLYFDVAAYRKPDIDLKVNFHDEKILAGENVDALIQANYYFGLPVAGQNYSWELYQREIDFLLPGYQVGPLKHYWTTPFFYDYFPLGERIYFGEDITDSKGVDLLSFPVAELTNDDEKTSILKQYNLEVTLMDESGLPVSARDSVLVHPETFYIGVQPDTYFGNAGSLLNFSILTVDWDAKPVSNVNLEATFEAIHWEVKETGIPQKPYEDVEITKIISGASPISNLEGKARVSFTPPEPGTYRLTLKAGNALTEVLVWVASESSAIWPVQMYNQLELIPDREEYQPGQVAEIFIPNPFAKGAKALMTVERGSVMRYEVIDAHGSGTVFSVPIDSESIPNLYVSVILLGFDDNGRPDYRQGTLKLPVSKADKTLNIDMEVVPPVTEPGEKVTLKMKITDKAGNPIQGEFSVSVVDKALLALLPSNSLPIIDDIYQEIPLSVETSLSLFTYTKQLSLVPLGAGGLGGGPSDMLEYSLREDFPDTAFWQADVITAMDGTAMLTIPLPDNLTTWVVVMRGLTDDFRVGEAEVEIKTQKPLMIIPVTPRFLVDGDWIEMAAIVHNNTPETLEIKVSLSASGFVLEDENPWQKITLEPGKNQRVVWWGQVESVDSVELVFQASAGDYIDASAPVWGDLHVKRYLTPNTFSTSGQLSEAGERLELISLPITTTPTSGALNLAMNPSLLTSLVEGLELLEGDSYKDIVSVLSRLIANLNTYLVLKNLDLATIPLGLNLERAFNSDINHILSSQNFDGGWSWWGTSNIEDQKSNPFLTAYVLLGLELANEAGVYIDEFVLERARDYLIFGMKQPGEVESAWMLDALVFQTYALKDHDFDMGSIIDSFYTRRTELSPWALGLLALTMRAHGEHVRINTLVADIEAGALRSATSVHWESERNSWMLPGTPIFNTAVVIYALAQLDPASISLPLGLSYLMSHRNSHGLWSSSFESSWVLMAIAKAIQGAGYYQADYAFRADLNESVIVDGLATGPDSLNAIDTSVPVSALYANSPNTLLIQRGEGAGTLFYRLDLHTYQPAARAPAINRGINLQRDYYPEGEGCPTAEGCEPLHTVTLRPDGLPQFVTVVLTINLAESMYNLKIEDFIPAGAEIVNPRLLTSPTIRESSDSLFDPRTPFLNGWGWWYFDQPQINDDSVLWTADYVPAGTYLLTYDLLPYQRGIFQVLPAHAWQMFYPEVQGTTSGDIFTIK